MHGNKIWYLTWCMFVRASYYKCNEKNQLDGTECFIAIIICSTCFRHSYAHHQELKTILVLLPRMVCNALVAGDQLLEVEQQAMRLGWGKLCDWVALGYVQKTNIWVIKIECKPYDLDTVNQGCIHFIKILSPARNGSGGECSLVFFGNNSNLQEM
jgi:hypothetical protein